MTVRGSSVRKGAPPSWFTVRNVNGTGKDTERIGEKAGGEKTRGEERATMKREGKIVLNLADISDLDQSKLYDIILELEQYLNDEVFLDCFRKFGIGLRFHLSV